MMAVFRVRGPRPSAKSKMAERKIRNYSIPVLKVLSNASRKLRAQILDLTQTMKTLKTHHSKTTSINKRRELEVLNPCFQILMNTRYTSIHQFLQIKKKLKLIIACTRGKKCSLYNSYQIKAEIYLQLNQFIINQQQLTSTKLYIKTRISRILVKN